MKADRQTKAKNKTMGKYMRRIATTIHHLDLGPQAIAFSGFSAITMVTSLSDQEQRRECVRARASETQTLKT